MRAIYQVCLMLLCAITIINCTGDYSNTDNDSEPDTLVYIGSLNIDQFIANQYKKQQMIAEYLYNKPWNPKGFVVKTFYEGGIDKYGDSKSPELDHYVHYKVSKKFQDEAKKYNSIDRYAFNLRKDDNGQYISSFRDFIECIEPCQLNQVCDCSHLLNNTPVKLNNLPSQNKQEMTTEIGSIPAIVDTITPVIKRPIINQEINEKLLSFTIPKSEKRIVLSIADNKRLIYTAFKQDGVQEFQFPLDKSNSFFQFMEEYQGAYSLAFQNSSASYRIYEEATKIGIIVKTGGKTYDLIGNLDTKEGSLQILSKLLLSNVIQ